MPEITEIYDDEEEILNQTQLEEEAEQQQEQELPEALPSSYSAISNSPEETTTAPIPGASTKWEEWLQGEEKDAQTAPRRATLRQIAFKVAEEHIPRELGRIRPFLPLIAQACGVSPEEAASIDVNDPSKK